MKNIIVRKVRAFSLAEALITLLIVCLITIASVPILTKKKRDMSKVAAGKWMCTINSQGQHVYWSSQTSDTDPTNPDTWFVSGEGQDCVFVPPVNGKNYAITVIGGGGGGADGVSERDIFMETQNAASRSVTETDTYRVAVIGSGGGGSGSDDKDSPNTNRGFGGQGGAGAHYIGELNFITGQTIIGAVPYGDSLRPTNDGGKKCNRKEYGKDASRAVLKVNDVELVAAGTGSAGGATRNKGGKSPDCGDGGDGGTISFSSSFSSFTSANSVKISGNGKKGRYNKNFRIGPDVSAELASGQSGQTSGCYEPYEFGNCYRGYSSAWHGTSIPASFWGGKDDYGPYGAGGWGATAKISKGQYGRPGAIIIWRIIQRPGMGGEAAKLNMFSVPTLKGKVKMVIGQGGLANQDGQTTNVDIYDLQGKVARNLQASGGEAGDKGPRVDEKYTTKEKTYEGKFGQHSLWNKIGGGLPGKCYVSGPHTKVETTTETEVETDDSGQPICELAILDLGSVVPKGTGNAYSCPLSDSTMPKGLCVGCEYPDCAYEYESGLDDGGDFYEKYTPLTVAATNYELFTDSFLLGDGVNVKIATTYSQLENLVKSYNSGKYIQKEWSTTSSNEHGYKLAVGKQPTISDDTYECIAYKTKTVTKTQTVVVNKNEPECEEAGKGTYFGAGGGGGATSNIISLFGKGGQGAPGAVIIEW